MGDLLDFAKPYAPLARTVGLATLVRGAVEAAARAFATSELKVEVDVEKDAPALELDSHRVRQALVNLIVNAMQATPEGGTVTVRAKVETRAGTRGACIDVLDQGGGVAPGDAERIFQPFFTTKANGTDSASRWCAASSTRTMARSRWLPPPRVGPSSACGSRASRARSEPRTVPRDAAAMVSKGRIRLPRAPTPL